MHSEEEATYLAGKLKDIEASSGQTHDGLWLRCNDNEVEGQWACEGSSSFWNSDADNQGYWGMYLFIRDNQFKSTAGRTL